MISKITQNDTRNVLMWRLRKHIYAMRFFIFLDTFVHATLIKKMPVYIFSGVADYIIFSHILVAFVVAFWLNFISDLWNDRKNFLGSLNRLKSNSICSTHFQTHVYNAFKVQTKISIVNFIDFHFFLPPLFHFIYFISRWDSTN